MSTTETISILSPYTLDRARRKFEQTFNGHLPDAAEEFLRDVDAFRKERKVVDLLELHERIHVSSKRLASVVGGGMWAELIGLIVKQIDERKAEAENLEYTVRLAHVNGNVYPCQNCAVTLRLRVGIYFPVAVPYVPPPVNAVSVMRKGASGECVWRVEIALKENEQDELSCNEPLSYGELSCNIPLSYAEWKACQGNVCFDIEFDDYFARHHKTTLNLSFVVKADIPDHVYRETTLNETGDPFVGRADLLNEIKNAISGSRGGKGYVITGLRRIGKSSFLHKVEHLVSSQNAEVKYYNCLSRGHDFSALLSMFESALNLEEDVSRLNAVNQEPIDDFRAKRILECLSHRGVPLIMEIDEFSEFYTADEGGHEFHEAQLSRLEDFLRGILDAGLCHLVLCVQVFFCDAQKCKNRYASFDGPHTLGYLSYDELSQLAALSSEATLSGGQYARFDEKAVLWLEDLTGGSPLFAQKTCKCAMKLMRLLNVQVVDSNICRMVEEILVPGFNEGKFLTPEFRLKLLPTTLQVERDKFERDKFGRVITPSDSECCRVFVERNRMFSGIQPGKDFESFFGLGLPNVQDECVLLEFYRDLTVQYAYDNLSRGTEKTKEAYLNDAKYRDVALGLMHNGIIKEVKEDYGGIVFRINVRLFGRWFALHRDSCRLSDF